MRYAYPCTLHEDEEGGFTVEFPDVPEAITSARTREEALDLAQDALVEALAARIHDRRNIPSPSRLALDQYLVPVPPVMAAKCALYQAVREQGLTKVAFASQLGVVEGTVRQLLDPRRRTHIGQVDEALRHLDRLLVVEDKAISQCRPLAMEAQGGSEMTGIHANTTSRTDNHQRGPAPGNGSAGGKQSIIDLESPLADAEDAVDVLIELYHAMQEGELERTETIGWAAYRLKDHIKELWDVYNGLCKAKQPTRQ